MIARLEEEASAVATHKTYCDRDLDTVESELLKSSMRDGSPRAARESGRLRLGVNVSQLDEQSQDEMGTLTTRLQGVREPQWQGPSRRQGRFAGCELRGLGVERSPTAL